MHFVSYFKTIPDELVHTLQYATLKYCSLLYNL
jgi:hypothetical protein